MSFGLSNILIGIFFGIVGVSAWRYGKLNTSERHMWLGVGLIGYSYFVSDAIASAAIGIILTILLFWP